MNLKSYYQSLKREDREAFAARAGTSTGYIETHLLRKGRTPHKDKMRSLAAASEGSLSYDDVVRFFMFDS